VHQLRLPIPTRVVVLVSGTGTLLQAVLDAAGPDYPAQVVAVGADRTGTVGLKRADDHGLPTFVVELIQHPDRAAWDAALTETVAAYRPDLIVTAGFMKILGRTFLDRFAGRILNSHPALLPAFPGLHAVEQALDYGVKVFGVTIHFVDDGVDTGPVILQRAIELPDARDADEVLERLHPIEHELLPEAVRLIARGGVSTDPQSPRRIRIER